LEELLKMKKQIKKESGTWLAQSVEYSTPDLRVMSSSPTLAVGIILKISTLGNGGQRILRL